MATYLTGRTVSLNPGLNPTTLAVKPVGWRGGTLDLLHLVGLAKTVGQQVQEPLDRHSIAAPLRRVLSLLLQSQTESVGNLLGAILADLVTESLTGFLRRTILQT